MMLEILGSRSLLASASNIIGCYKFQWVEHGSAYKVLTCGLDVVSGSTDDITHGLLSGLHHSFAVILSRVGARASAVNELLGG